MSWLPHSKRATRGFSLVELMIVVAVAALIIGLAAPSFSEYIVTQRVRSVHAQLTTDLQYARSEAAARGRHIGVKFQFTTGDSGASCYTIYARPDPDWNPRSCDCFAPAGSRCTSSGTTEIRTVLVPNSLKVFIRVATGQHDIVNFSPQSGGYVVGVVPGASAADLDALATNGFIVGTQADDTRALRIVVNATGRPQQCTPASSRLGGDPCP